MTRIHAVSDLHLEFGGFALPQVTADVTVLAGDIYTKVRGAPNLGDLAFGRPTLAVSGNHDVWGDKVDTGIPKLRQAMARHGVTLLENEAAVVGGVRFLGCTLWSDYRLFAGDDLDQVRADANLCVGSRYGGGLNDFRKIRVARDGYRCFRPLDAARLHAASLEWLASQFALPFPGPTVVVTHHAPSRQAVAPGHAADHRSAAYASDLDGFIARHQPALWIYGHIHPAVAHPWRIGRTLMVSNPRGYVGVEVNPAFRPDFVIEVNGSGAVIPV